MADERQCVVCGMGSNRPDWVKSAKAGSNSYVACDNHTDQEMMAAVNAAEIKAKAAAAPPANDLQAAAAAAAQKKPS